MVCSAFVEVCGGIIHSFTHSVADHFNPSEAEFGYNYLESTGLEWDCRPVEELIYQEYSDREAIDAGHIVYNVHVRILNASSP